MDSVEKKHVILRGLGKFYGHIIKAELLEIDEITFSAKIRTADGDFWFNIYSGFEAGVGKNIGFTTYQLDIDTLNLGLGKTMLSEHFKNLREV